MIVVVILGVLSVVAITGYRKYVYSARNTAAIQFLGAVRAAQEAYFQSFGQYCGASIRPSIRTRYRIPTNNARGGSRAMEHGETLV